MRTDKRAEGHEQANKRFPRLCQQA